MPDNKAFINVVFKLLLYQVFYLCVQNRCHKMSQTFITLIFYRTLFALVFSKVNVTTDVKLIKTVLY